MQAIDEYLAKLSDERKQTLTQVRKTIQEAIGKLSFDRFVGLYEESRKK